MPGLQELISRGRLLFASAPSRLEIFRLVNGRSTAKEIARRTARPLRAVINDINKMKNAELIRPRTDREGMYIKKERSQVYEKTPLVKSIPSSYFFGVTKPVDSEDRTPAKAKQKKSLPKITVPTPREIIEICRRGEDQFYEFKAAPVDTSKITREIAGFVHTRRGGILFYGVDDSGGIRGSNLRRQEFDNRLHNSIRNTINPPPNIEVKSVEVMGCTILLVVIPPWDREHLYQYEERYYIRKGAGIFALKPEEIRQLSKGKYIV